MPTQLVSEATYGSAFARDYTDFSRCHNMIAFHRDSNGSTTSYLTVPAFSWMACLQPNEQGMSSPSVVSKMATMAAWLTRAIFTVAKLTFCPLYFCRSSRKGHEDEETTDCRGIRLSHRPQLGLSLSSSKMAPQVN